MTVFILVLIAIIIVPVGIVVLRSYFGYTARDILFFAFLLFPVVTLRKFEEMFVFSFLGRFYLGYFVFLTIWLIVFLIVTMQGGRRTHLQMVAVGACLAILFAEGILSGIVNDQSLLGIGAPLHAALQWAWPFIVICVVFKSMPDTLETHERMMTAYVIAHGYIASIITILFAVFTEQVGSFLGRGDIAAYVGEAGFVRGRTSLGSTVITGFLLVLAYALCLSQILRKHRTKFHLIAAVLCVIALMFTLARSALVAFVLVNIPVLRGIFLKYLGRIVVSSLVMAILLAPILLYINQKYDFGRLLTAVGESTTIRTSSAIAAASAGLENPILGKGPGLFYSTVRAPRMGKRFSTIVVAERYSAEEPHNAYALFFAENGLIGLGLLITVFVLFVRRMSRGRMLCNILPEEEPISNAYWAIMVTMAVFALTSSTLWVYMRPATGIWPIIFLGFHHVACMEKGVQQVDPCEYV